MLLGLLGLVVGWQAFRFLCDDAFIDFRYVANARAGFGLVWNLPPFQPVEGYTSLLWVLILWAAWALTGLDPTRTADWLGLLFSTGSLLLTARWALRVLGGEASPARRAMLLGLVLGGTLTNRTFLAWTSSGLETPLWTFLLLGWADAMWTARRSVGVWAMLLCLTRPDGILFAGATAVGVVGGAGAWRTLLPLLLVPAHLLWRHEVYGQWVPNTAFAKVTAAWPEAGIRYLAAFVLEYAWWLAPVLVATLGLAAVREARIGRAHIVVGLAFLAHFAWYTFWVGGDHFEFRIYAHLIPLGWLLLLGLLWRSRGAVPALATQLALSLPIPWAHFAATQGPGPTGQVHEIVVPVAPLLPAPLSTLAGPWDELQAWLIPHYIGVRHQEHKAFALGTRSVFGPRRGEPSLDPDNIPVFSAISIGIAGWTLPTVAVIDPCGLVDAVVARNPNLRPGDRMAHQRQPPEGYVECFQPDVGFAGDRLMRQPRASSLTAEDVTRCEGQFWAAAGLDRLSEGTAAR